ncbi:MAG: methyl-accepting chemotaxis protein [Motiliproteus sp.]
MGSPNQNTKSTMKIGQKIDLTLAGIFISLLILSSGYQYNNQREIVEAMVLEQAGILGSSFFDNVNTLMITGQMNQQEIARTKVTSHDGVLDARILRSDVVKQLYGPGKNSAQAVDELDRRALAGEELQIIEQGDNGRVLTQLTPLLASEDFNGTNCMTCHPAKAGTVLGAIRIDYSLQQFDEHAKEQLWLSTGLNALLLILAWLIIRIILRRLVIHPLRTISATIHTIEQSANLDLKIDLDRGDELGTVASSFNSMIERFRGIVVELNLISNKLSSQTVDFNKSSQQGLSSSHHLTSEMDQVATAMTELEQTAQCVAENATQALTATQKAEEQTQQGQQAVATAIKGIEDLASELTSANLMTEKLHHHSDEITQIVNVISDIAEQTNLLALNAAIEAARAGEQGRGFAVVADEVRALASRTGQSTIQIREMISGLQKQTQGTLDITAQSSEQAQNSVTQSKTTGDLLTMVNDSVINVSQLNSENATAANQQTQVAGEINKSILTINEIANQSEDDARRMAEASGELEKLTHNLNSIIDQFNVKL